MIAEENPIIPAIDQDLWAQRLDYNKRKLSQALETFRRTRAENYELLKDLPEEAFARTAQHTKRGVVTLMQMLEIFARHPEKHVGQIQAARAAFKEFKAAQAQPAARLHAHGPTEVRWPEGADHRARSFASGHHTHSGVCIQAPTTMIQMMVIGMKTFQPSRMIWS